MRHSTIIKDTPTLELLDSIQTEYFTELCNEVYMEWYEAWEAYESSSIYEQDLPAETFGDLLLKRLQESSWVKQ